MIKSDITELKKWSKTIIDVVCDNCKIDKSISYKLYTSYGYENGEYLCRKCKIKKNNLEKWGVENPFQLDSVKEKIKKTNLEKFGVENPSQNKQINKKIKESISKLDKDSINSKREATNLERWGVRNISQSKEIKIKKEETNIKNWGANYLETKEFREYLKNKNLEKWGNEIYFKTDDFLNKSKNTNLEKWGVENPSKNKEVINKIKTSLNKSLNRKTLNKFDNIVNINSNTFEIFCDYCSSNFIISKILFYKRRETKTTICTKCNTVDKQQSGKEILLLNFIKSIYDGEIIQNFRIERNEIDIYLPDLNLGFEFNGVYWHSDIYKEKYFHFNKSKFFSEKNIHIFHIWEDIWDEREMIIKSQIKNILGKSQRIWARNCEVREINDISLIRDFLNNNHVQGWKNSNIKIGLFLNNELMCAMTFDKFEGRKKMTLNEWNLNRFCNKSGVTVVGGFSKLLNFFIKSKRPNRIISYSDRDWSKGNLYSKSKFKKVYETQPDYKYLIESKRIHKSNFKKSVTGISEKYIEIPKIWDCGKDKWELITSDI